MVTHIIVLQRYFQGILELCHVQLSVSFLKALYISIIIQDILYHFPLEGGHIFLFVLFSHKAEYV